MRKEEFFEQLEYLLQDIPDPDREEALDYYRDYLAEAGSENEEQAIENFGSPERVAAIIRADLSGNLKEGGSFTETGYEDERFRDPSYQVAKRLDLPDERSGAANEDFRQEGSGAGNYRSVSEPNGKEAKKPWTNKTLKVILWVVLIVMASPFILGTAGIGVGTIAGLLSLVFGGILVLVCLTAAAMIAGVCLIVLAAVLVVKAPFDSIFLFGIAIFGIGVGLLCVVALYLILGVALPFLWKQIGKAGAWIVRKCKGGERA